MLVQSLRIRHDGRVEFAELRGRRRRMTSGVLLPVSHHRRALSEALAAEVADVRSLAGVGEPVDGQGVRPDERLRAVAALERPLAGVHSIVKQEAVIGRELLAAVGAQEFSGVYPDVVVQKVLGREELVAYLALVLSLEDLQHDAVDRALVSGQRGLLQVPLAAELADEALRAEVAGLVVLELAVRHEALAALVALVPEVFAVHPTNVVPDGDFAGRRVVALVAAELHPGVERHVGRQSRFTLEQLLADVALVGFDRAVVHHVNLQSALARETPTAGLALEAHRCPWLGRFCFSPNCDRFSLVQGHFVEVIVVRGLRR